ncbi:MAG: hypothetical protein GX335_04010 [Firmicutes bacterium]|nr:hypothetical protein [Bacillota bacterium]
MESLSAQLYSFGIVLLAGVSLGILFDVFRVARGLLRPGVISTPLLDLFFWALFTPLLLLYLLLANWGELRGYVIVGLGLGFFFYKLFLGEMMITLLLGIVRLGSMLLNLVITFGLWLLSIPLVLIQEIRFSSGRKGERVRKRWKPRLRWRK